MSVYITIDVEPTHLTKSGQRYRSLHEGEVLVDSSKDPLSDSARALLALPDTEVDDILVMMRGPSIVMYGRLGFIAAHAAREGDNSPPRFVKWAPYFGPQTDEE